MQDVQNYQYYDPAPQPEPQPWWKKSRAWKSAALIAVGVFVVVFAGVMAANVLKNHKLAKNDQQLMHEADAIASRLSAECDPSDAACLELARADAARELGRVQACDELSGEAYVSCVTLIAQDTGSSDACGALTGPDKTACLDKVYIGQAGTGASLADCDKISDAATAASCRYQTKSRIIAEGRCAEEGIDVGECEAAAAVNGAIATGDPAACAALSNEDDQYRCQQGIENVDADGDGLSVSEEVSHGLSDTIADGDGDGLSDGDEVHVYTTDPTKADTDGDGYSDGQEVQSGHDPLK